MGRYKEIIDAAGNNPPSQAFLAVSSVIFMSSFPLGGPLHCPGYGRASSLLNWPGLVPGFFSAQAQAKWGVN